MQTVAEREEAKAEEIEREVKKEKEERVRLQGCTLMLEKNRS